MLRITTVQSIEASDLDALVRKTYGRPFKYQQQDGSRERGTHDVSIPDPLAADFENDEIPEEINGDDMGVSFKAWLERTPDAPVSNLEAPYEIALFWERNFYPDLGTLLNDLHERRLVPAGDYQIVIDW